MDLDGRHSAGSTCSSAGGRHSRRSRASARRVPDDVRRRRVDDVAGRPRVQPTFHRHGERRRQHRGGGWEMSKDGMTWNLDFELTYVRER